MVVSGVAFGGLAVALVFDVSTGIGVPPFLLSEKTVGLGLWNIVFRLHHLPQCMIAVRPLRRPSHLTIGPSRHEVSSET